MFSLMTTVATAKSVGIVAEEPDSTDQWLTEITDLTDE